MCTKLCAGNSITGCRSHHRCNRDYMPITHRGKQITYLICKLINDLGVAQFLILLVISPLVGIQISDDDCLGERATMKLCPWSSKRKRKINLVTFRNFSQHTKFACYPCITLSLHLRVHMDLKTR